MFCHHVSMYLGLVATSRISQPPFEFGKAMQCTKLDLHYSISRVFRGTGPAIESTSIQGILKTFYTLAFSVPMLVARKYS